MEKCLREAAFEVITNTALVGLGDNAGEGDASPSDGIRPGLKRRYFHHEFRRLVGLLFLTSARDLSDSAAEDEPIDESAASRMRSCSRVTGVEHASILLTHSACGHAFRVYLVSSWLMKLVRRAEEAGFFDDGLCVADKVDGKLHDFLEAWLEGRLVAYSKPSEAVPLVLRNLLVLIFLMMPFLYVSVAQWANWFPGLVLVVSFVGTMQIANNMENPFGFD